MIMTSQFVFIYVISYTSSSSNSWSLLRFLLKQFFGLRDGKETFNPQNPLFGVGITRRMNPIGKLMNPIAIDTIHSNQLRPKVPKPKYPPNSVMMIWTTADTTVITMKIQL